MSRRMYEALLSVGDFPHQVIPLTMESTKLDPSQPNYRAIDSENFVAIQFLEHVDYLDRERSIYSPEGDYPTQYVLNEPPEGFPPVFRLAANPEAVFITAEAREALKEAGILGTAYTPTSNIELPREVDLPVPIVGTPVSTFEISFNGTCQFQTAALARSTAEQLFNSGEIEFNRDDIDIRNSFLMIHKTFIGDTDDWYAYSRALEEIADKSIDTYISCKNEVKSDDCGALQVHNVVTNRELSPDLIQFPRRKNDIGQGDNVAYRLSWGFDHLDFGDAENDVNIEQFEGWRETSWLMKTTPYNLPDQVVFFTNFELLACTDFPVNDVNWPIMSRRMYYVLQSLGNFPHQVIPIAMVHDRFSDLNNPPELFLEDGQPNPELTNFDDYVAIQLLEESDYFDFDDSVYIRHKKNPQEIHTVETYVLNRPSQGFPPIFRLRAYPRNIFISAEARQALEEAGIRGPAYFTLDDGYGTYSEIDIPLQLPIYS
jgi:hypothetical protein